MKLTKTNLKNLKSSNNNTLKDDVINYVLDEWDNYDDKKDIFKDVLYHGCQSGIVGHLIYYSDTTRYYEEHKSEINELLYNTLWGCGFKSPNELFGDKWDKEDPLAIDMLNQNLLAWFGFEETMRSVAMEFEELHNYC